MHRSSLLFSQNIPSHIGEVIYNAARTAKPAIAKLPAPAMYCAAPFVTCTGAEEVVTVLFFDAEVVATAVVFALETWDETVVKLDEATEAFEVETTVDDAVVDVLTGAELVATDEDVEAGVLEVETAVEVAARTDEQAAWASERTVKASVAPQAERTQEVAADWIAASLLAVHWQAKSVWEQVVAEVTAAAIHDWAQVGMVD
jgi:hypothetical protein